MDGRGVRNDQKQVAGKVAQIGVTVKTVAVAAEGAEEAVAEVEAVAVVERAAWHPVATATAVEVRLRWVMEGAEAVQKSAVQKSAVAVQLAKARVVELKAVIWVVVAALVLAGVQKLKVVLWVKRWMVSVVVQKVSRSVAAIQLLVKKKVQEALRVEAMAFVVEKRVMVTRSAAAMALFEVTKVKVVMWVALVSTLAAAMVLVVAKKVKEAL